MAGDWVCEVDQAAYGHLAAKKTWLLFHGPLLPPPLNFKRTRGTHQIGGFDRTLPDLPRSLRVVTPPAFKEILLAMARSVRA